MKESFYIELITKKVEEKLQWRPSEEWAEYDFKKLSDILFESTGTLINPLTLKRIYKNAAKGTYNPRQGTKDALAKYAGYKDWHEFIETSRPKSETQSPEVFSKPAFKINLKKLTIVLILAALALIAVYLILKMFNNNSVKDEKILFYTDINIGSPPFVASFKYDVSMLKEDSFYIQYVDGEVKHIKKIDKNGHQVNLSMELPGIIQVELKTGNRILAITYVTVTSNGWYSFIAYRDRPVGVFTKDYKTPMDTFLYDTIHDGSLYFPPAFLKKHSFNITVPYFVHHHFYEDLKCNGEDCIMEVRFRNSSKDGGQECHGCQFYLCGDTCKVIVGITDKHCYSYAFLHIAGDEVRGENSNLSSLGLNVEEWGIIKIGNLGDYFSLVYNNDTLFQAKHKSRIGDIKGLLLFTQGTGQFDYVKLYDHQGKVYYNNDFN